MGREGRNVIFCFVREIDHFCWVILFDDGDVAEEGFVGALEIFDTCLFRFLAEFWGNGVFEVREGFSLFWVGLCTLGILGTLGDF